MVHGFHSYVTNYRRVQSVAPGSRSNDPKATVLALLSAHGVLGASGPPEVSNGGRTTETVYGVNACLYIYIWCQRMYLSSYPSIYLYLIWIHVCIIYICMYDVDVCTYPSIHPSIHPSLSYLNTCMYICIQLYTYILKIIKHGKLTNHNREYMGYRPSDCHLMIQWRYDMMCIHSRALWDVPPTTWYGFV